MILTKDLIAEELLTTFKVLKVHHEPYAESVWTLQFEDYPPIEYFDKCFDTIEEDEQLVGRYIKAQIDLIWIRDVVPLRDPDEQKKSLYCENDVLIATGIYFEDNKEIEPKYDTTRIKSCVDSLFKLRVMDNLSASPHHLKHGDWVRITTIQRCIIIAREYTPLPE